jgi:hypothetical protein
MNIDAIVENFRDHLNEKLVFGSNEKIKEYAYLIYTAYVSAPEEDMSASYNALKKSNEILFKRMMSKIDVNFTDRYDDIGYGDANDMVARIKDSGVLHVDTRYSDNNPYFTEEENWIFRAVHDYYTHNLRGKKFKQSYNFNLKGEFQTYNTHAKLAPTDALPALFTEVICQISFEVITGAFPDPQKSAFIRGVDMKNLGIISFQSNAKSLTVGSGTYEQNFSSEEDMLSKLGEKGVEIYRRWKGESLNEQDDLKFGNMSPLNQRVFNKLEGADSSIRTVGIMSAENPMAVGLSAEENEQIMSDFYRQLDEEGLSFLKIKGHYGDNPENSVIIWNISPEKITEYLYRYKQDSVILGVRQEDRMVWNWIDHKKGEVLHQSDTILYGPEIQQLGNYYSEFNGIKFVIDFDF